MILLFLRKKNMQSTKIQIFLSLAVFTLHASLFPAKAYRIEITHQAVANTSVFLAAYYGDQVSVVDSVAADANGRAVFERNYDLCTGMYTIVAPGKLACDLLLDAGQQLRVEWSSTGNIHIEGDEQTAAWTAYQNFADTRPGKEALVERQKQIIAQFPGTFLAAYLKALQPVEPPNTEVSGNADQLLQTYQYRRRNFFNNMPLSDVRLLHTPLYHETIQYYFTQFVTRQTDTLIHIAYRMLEQASGHYETFFYLSDFLIDFSLRSKIEGVSRLHNFVNRNRDMLGTKGMAMLPARSNANYFKIPGEKSLQNRLETMTITGIDGNSFDLKTVRNKYNMFYFWQNDYPRCIADVSRWQSVLNRFTDKSCSGIAVNVKYDVQHPENRILAYDPVCTNVSVVNTPWCKTIFFALLYSKIVVTDMDGSIIGIFASSASLTNFLKIVQ